jgi:hypothetical protein
MSRIRRVEGELNIKNKGESDQRKKSMRVFSDNRLAKKCFTMKVK